MSQPFHVYGAALGLVSALRPVLGELMKSDRCLADQLRRGDRGRGPMPISSFVSSL